MAAMVILAGCAQQTDQGDPVVSDVSGTTENSDKVTVVTSFYPLAYIAGRIGGEKINVVNITGATDPHDYDLSPRDIATLQGADLVILNGAGFEPWGEDIEAQLKQNNVPVVTVTQGMVLVESDENTHGDEEHEEHKEHEEDHEDGEKHEEHGEHEEHGHGGVDPHVWVDPVRMQEITSIVADAIVDVSPENADVYQERADIVTADFVALDKLYTDGLAQCDRREVIVSHDAFGYLADRYDFTAHAIAGLSTLDEPSAQTLAALKDEAAEGVTHILMEENSAGRFASTLATETGLTLLQIDPLASSASQDNGDFLSRATGNFTVLEEALGCSTS